MHPLFFTPALAFGLVAMALVCERSRLASWILVVGFLSAFAGGLLLGDVEMRPFTWVKVLTLLAAMVLLNLVRFSDWGRRNLWIAPAMLILNILEATVSDFTTGHVVNAGVGLVLCILTLRPPKGRPSVVGDVPNLQFPVSRLWILAYTAWNLAFVTRFYPSHASDQLAVLGVPLLWVAYRPHGWLQARCYTISAYALLIVTWEEAFELPWAPSWFVPSDWLSGGAEIAAVALTGLAFVGSRAQKT